ncbi:MAG: AAA family ATPase, partial [Planctomycetota bacterium]|nr:AAA family ATPase [Planctomycetota bacterium]
MVVGEEPLPVLVSYGAGRAWTASNERPRKRQANGKNASRWDAYDDCLNERIRVPDLLNWFTLESAARDTAGRYRPGFETVRHAIQQCIPGAEELSFDHQRLEPVIRIAGNDCLFSNLSDGQKVMASMVADIAIKAVTLNSYLLNEKVADEPRSDLPVILRKTPGVVLIDELDVHLHPAWQRRVVSDLSKTFPCMQFGCTTHSPQVIGEVRHGCVRSLENGRAFPLARSFGLDSSRVLEEGMHA